MISSKSWCPCTKSMLVCCHKKWLMKKMTGLKQLMKLCLLRNTKYTSGSKKLKMTINQDPVELHQRNHQEEAQKNLQVLQKPSRQEAPWKNINEGESTGRETKNGRVTDRSLIAAICNAKSMLPSETPKN